MCTAFFCCCCRRKLLGCLAPHSSACSSFLLAQLLRSLRNRSSETGAGTGTEGTRFHSGGGGNSANRSGEPCCEANPVSTLNGWATRRDCSSSAGSPRHGARRGTPDGKSRARSRPRPLPRPRLPQSTSPRRGAPRMRLPQLASPPCAAPAHCVSQLGARRYFPIWAVWTGTSSSQVSVFAESSPPPRTCCGRQPHGAP